MQEEKEMGGHAQNGQFQEVIQDLKGILVNDLDIHLEMGEIDESTQLVERGLALDSVVIAELITCVENRFDFQFDDTDMSTENFRNLTTLANLILSRREPMQNGNAASAHS